MPKISVYLPDDLYRLAREHNLPLSAVAQRAIETELKAASTDRWVAAVRARPRRHCGDIRTAELLDEVRDEFGR
jgi:post-segregation antitoxin (ccd killing protein)